MLVKSMRKYVVFLCVFALTGALAGPASAKVKISLIHRPLNKETFETTLELFKTRRPDIEIDLTWVTGGWRDEGEKIVAMSLAGMPPDVVSYVTEETGQFSATGMLMPLEGLVSRDRLDLSQWFPATIEACKYRGRLMGLPTGINAHAQFYNVAMFDKAGLSYPGADWSWDRFVEAAKKLTQRASDGVATQFGFQMPGANPWDIGPIVAQNGGQILDDDWTRSLVDQPDAYEAVQWAGNLRWVHEVTPKPGEAGNFNGQKVAMAFLGQGNIGGFSSRGVPFDVHFLPQGKAGQATYLGGGMYGIHPQSPHKDAAWDLIRFLAGREFQSAMTGVGGISALKAVSLSPERLAFPKGMIHVANQLYYARTNPAPVNRITYETAFREAVLKVFNNELDARRAMEQASQQINAALADI